MLEILAIHNYLPSEPARPTNICPIDPGTIRDDINVDFFGCDRAV